MAGVQRQEAHGDRLMPWGRVDSDFWRHRKVDALNLSLAHACVGVFWLAVAWSNDKGTDGLLNPAAIRQLGITPEEAEELVRVGMWDREGDALRVHDFLDFNRSAAQIAEEKQRREEAGRAGADARWNGTSHSKSHGSVDGKPDAPYPVSRIPVTPLPASPPRASDDPADAYWSLTGKYPTGKALEWIDSLIDRYGSEATTKALASAFITDKTVNTLLGRTRDILAAEARRLDIKERDDERERVRQKRAKPREMDPMEQAFRDALLKRYGNQENVA